jgi:hypothetical protein
MALISREMSSSVRERKGCVLQQPNDNYLRALDQKIPIRRHPKSARKTSGYLISARRLYYRIGSLEKEKDERRKAELEELINIPSPTEWRARRKSSTIRILL